MASKRIRRSALAESLEQRTLLTSPLEVPYYNQDGTGWCGFASLSMMLEYYGYDRKPWQVAADFDKPVTLGLDAPDDLDETENYLETYYSGTPGDDWQLDTFHGSLALEDMLRSVLDAGDPIWIGSNAANHAVVVTGYIGDQVFVNDPSGALTGSGSEVVQHVFTWTEFRSRLDLYWFWSGQTGVWSIHARDGAFTDVSSTLSVQVQPHNLWFDNSVGNVERKLEFVWDGSAPYEGGYRYATSSSNWYSADSDNAYVNYGYNATNADTLHLEASYSNYALPGQTLYARTRAEIRRASDGQLVQTLTSGVDTLAEFTWNDNPSHNDISLPLSAIPLGAYRVDVKVEGGSSSNVASFSVRDQTSFYFGVTASPGGDATPPTASLAFPTNGAYISQATINGAHYIEVSYSDLGGSGLNASTVSDAPAEFSLSGAVGTVQMSGAPALVNGKYRYSFTGAFGIGQVNVAFLANTWADNAGNGNAAASRSFTVTSSTVNAPPTISSFPDYQTPTSTPITIPFTISDAETPANSLLLGFGSSNTTLVPLQNVSFGGNGSNRTITITPVTGNTGATTMTVSVTDAGGLQTGTNFVLTVGNTSGSLPDLRGQYFHLTSSSRDAGETVTAEYKVANIGFGNSGAFNVAFYLSDNDTISTSDYLLGTSAIGALAADTLTSTLSKSLTLPSRGDDFWEGDGEYWIGMIVDSSAQIVESNELNNRNRGSGLDSDSLTVHETTVLPPERTISVADTTVIEGNFWDAEAVFTVSVAGGTPANWGASYTLSAGSATGGLDFQNVYGSFTVGASMSTAEIRIIIEGDDLTEGNETFFLTLSNPVGATLGDATATATIIDNELPGAGSPRHAWSTYVGGDFVDQAFDVATDVNGNAYVVGQTNIINDSWAVGGHDTVYGGNGDGFLAKFDREGHMLWSTYWGGTGPEQMTRVAVGADGTVYTIFNGGELVAFSPSGSHLWSLGGVGIRGTALVPTADGVMTTAIGGALFVNRFGVASPIVGNIPPTVDLLALSIASDGSIYLGGSTQTIGLASGGHDTTHNGRNDAYVAKLFPDGTPSWSTYLGGAWHEDVRSILVDAADQVIVVGRTSTADWSNTSSTSTANDVFVAKFMSNGSLSWLNRYGGAAADMPRDATLAPNGGVIIGGITESSAWANFPFDNAHRGATDAFTIEVDANGQPVWGTYIGGDEYDSTEGIVLTSDDSLFMAGSTSGGWVSGGEKTTTMASTAAYVARLQMPDRQAPSVSQGSFEWSTRHAVILDFSEDILGSLDPSDLLLTNTTTGSPVPSSSITLLYDSQARRATLTFDGFNGAILPDGAYHLSLPSGSIEDAAGNVGAEAFAFDFHVLAGDANRDRVVNFSDLLILAQNYGQSNRTFSQGNFDYSSDGFVGFSDLLLLAQRYGDSILAWKAPTPFASKRITRDVLTMTDATLHW